ncbi:hypothetical protein FHU10_3828 [Serratia fonticola]|uniref:Cupin type-2 domain-containing protein n=1 Tax=Serratia fonticola TaxID=47917 RepID=A0A542BRQ6_SERFO|nr:cupin domain-containing protein [Serratia fonticola]TQI81263.1 hypothetical protein FHU09_3879 [Serratia fonticola]TQI96713.1 cupin domain [Serratia fonticola]TVZ71209.1 hypothetical protein FHU10_3828 [Serratia fonticola]
MNTTDINAPGVKSASPIRQTYLPAGSGPKVWMSGDEYQILLDAQSSDNTMTLIDALIPPGSGPPMHLHDNVDELFFVQVGELDIMVDDVTHQVKAGGRVFVKRGVPHAFTNRSDQVARMLIFYTPGGIEAFFLAAGQTAIEGVTPPEVTEESQIREINIASYHHISQKRANEEDVIVHAAVGRGT